jgi:hypothetical protein
MKSLSLLTLLLVLTALSGCYTAENAEDVNQDRIKTNYETVFNATRKTTTATIHFRFGQTPLRLSNPMYYANKRLQETKDIIFGLHYTRTVDGIGTETYEWTNEQGDTYRNSVKPYSFDLHQPVKELKKYTYYKLPWTGQEIPDGSAEFSITVMSLVENVTTTFTSGHLIEIHSDNLDILPAGRARMTIARKHNEPIDERTEAGGRSTISFEREYEIVIIP